MMQKRASLMGIAVVIFIIATTALKNCASADEIQTITARSQKALFLVRVNKEHGTGFLVSRDPPLVATVAHIVSKTEKPETIIVQENETGILRKVRTAHIHKNFKLDQGGKNPYSTDVALLELEASKDVLGLPLTLMRKKIGEDFRGAKIVSMGFPGYTTLGGERQSPEAVIRYGIVSRLVDYDGSTTSPLPKRPMFEHSLDILKGESGSPIILSPSGKVIAIHVGNRRFTKKGTTELITAIHVAIYVDELWTLIEQINMAKPKSDK